MATPAPTPTVRIDGSDTALVLLNLQHGYRMYNSGALMVPPLGQVATNVAALLSAFRQRERPFVVHMREDQADGASFLHPGHLGHQFESWAVPAPGELVLAKTNTDAFLMTELHNLLRRRGIRTLVLVGYTTEGAVNATALSARIRGYATVVVPDGTATWGDVDEGLPAEQVWGESMDAYEANGVVLRSTKAVLGELLPHA